MGAEQTHAVELEIHVGVYDGKGGALFNEQKMRQPVVHLVVAQSHHVGGQQVHDLDGGDSLKFAVDQRAAEHIAGDGVDNIFFLVANLVDVAGQPGHAAHQMLVHLLCQKVAVQVVGVQDRQLLQVFHAMMRVPFILFL